MKAIQETIEILKKEIPQRCEEIDLGCFQCRCWIAIDFLEDFLELQA